jgi:hypothetical protein
MGLLLGLTTTWMSTTETATLLYALLVYCMLVASNFNQSVGGSLGQRKANYCTIRLLVVQYISMARGFARFTLPLDSGYYAKAKSISR